MLASKTSHKRRRSSARGDASRKNASTPRAIVTAAGLNKGKEREQPEQRSWAWKRLEKVIASHPINHSIQIVAPVNDIEEAQTLIERLPKLSFIYLVKAPISLFLDPIFVTSHIKRGTLIAISKGNLDTDDVLCLDGKGVLHLSLTRDTYQTLGLVGQVLKQSRTSSGKGRDRLSGRADRWMVHIDLLAPSFLAGKPGFDRTLDRLREWDVRRSSKKPSWDVLFSWTNGEVDMGSKMHFPANSVKSTDVRELEVKPTSSIIEECWTPSYCPKWDSIMRAGDINDNDAICDEVWTDALEGYLEWASLACMSSNCIKTYNRPDHISSYEVGMDRRASLLVKIEYRGLLCSELCATIAQVAQLWLSNRQQLSTNETSSVVISCSGFADSPIAWRMDPSLEAVSQVPLQGVEDEDEDSATSDDEFDAFESMVSMTDRKARKKRQKKRSRRGHISRHQVGEQVKRPGLSGYNGWQVVLFDGSDQECPEYVSVENSGGCLRC